MCAGPLGLLNDCKFKVYDIIILNMATLKRSWIGNCLDLGYCESNQEFHGDIVGIFNDAEGSILDGSMIGLFNFAADAYIEGNQYGGRNLTRDIIGGQWGVWNTADYVKGKQIGGIDVCSERMEGDQVGIICYAKDGEFRQFGVLTIRGSGPWYTRVSPIFGFKGNKRDEP